MTNKLTLVALGLGFLFWAGNKSVMLSTLGDKLIYPTLIVSLIAVAFSLIFSTMERQKLSARVENFSAWLQVIALLMYLILWFASHYFGVALP